MVVYISVQNGKVFSSKTKFYMLVKRRLYSIHAPNFIPTDACLVPLFDCLILDENPQQIMIEIDNSRGGK